VKTAIIGVDLDNTIICYDEAFHRAALERAWIAAETPVSKNAVKSAILASAGNERWTELQGYVYGPGIQAAQAYPGVVEFFRACSAREIPTTIISHKTQFAAAGPHYDLRAAAAGWLNASGLIGLPHQPAGHVIFASTRAEKIDAIRRLGCTTVIDDLPEIFEDSAYPRETDFILFDPDDAHADWSATPRAKSWLGIAARLLS
jgi:hypothetical protein